MTAEHQRIAIPDAGSGSRVDAALARLLDVSRSAVAQWCADGRVLRDGAPLAKSDRVHAGDVLDVDVPDPGDKHRSIPEAVDGMGILLDDEDFVVVDKPVGVAAHPSPGWVGPTVVGAHAAAG